MIKSRGVFIVFEGCDKVGKSTQIEFLAKKLNPVKIFKYPDRTTESGKLIDKYLKKEEIIDGSSEIATRANHEKLQILFSENRRESAKEIIQLLTNGINVIADRYVYSGIVYTLSLQDFCVKNIKTAIDREINLPKPDVIFLLKNNNMFSKILNEELFEEKSIQTKVSEYFDRLSLNNSWIVVDVSKYLDYSDHFMFCIQNIRISKDIQKLEYSDFEM